VVQAAAQARPRQQNGGQCHRAEAPVPAQALFVSFTSCVIGPDQDETHQAGRSVADLATKRHVDAFALYIAPDWD
jgi:hypothetical protein